MSCDAAYDIIHSYVTLFNMDGPSDDIDHVLKCVAKRIGALMKGITSVHLWYCKR